MKKHLKRIISITLLLLLFISTIAFAAGTIDNIHTAENIDALETAINDISELSDEALKLSKLDTWEKNNLLTKKKKKKM